MAPPDAPAALLAPHDVHSLLGEIVQLASDAIISIDEHQRILLFNRGAEEIFGYAADEVLGRPLNLLIPPRYHEAHDAEHLPAFARAHGASRRMGERREVYGRRRDGEEFPAEVSISKGSVDGRRVYNAVVRDATERRRYEAELHARGEALARSNRARETVLGVVAHDLRNPLATVKMCASALAEKPAPPEAAADELYAVIRRSAEWMEHIIRDLLDVSRIEAGHLPLDPRPVRPAAVLDTLRELHAPLAADARLALDVRAAPDVPALRADPDRLLQALGNLLGNALKFTPAGGRVTVRAAGAGGGGGAGGDADGAPPRVCFAVADTGPGIHAEHLPHLFDRFWQATESRRAGAGLGLAIAKGIAEAHGGTLRVESRVGEGTTFVLELPVEGGGVGARG